MDEDYAAYGGYDDNDFADRLKHEGSILSTATSQCIISGMHVRKLTTRTRLLLGFMKQRKQPWPRAISAVRNFGREWGALEPIDLSSIATLESSPPAIRTYSGCTDTPTMGLLWTGTTDIASQDATVKKKYTTFSQ